MKPNINKNCASNFSLEFFLQTFIKHDAGNIIQIATPIVDPTNPMINSIDGIKMPINKASKTNEMVISLNRCSGM